MIHMSYYDARRKVNVGGSAAMTVAMRMYGVRDTIGYFVLTAMVNDRGAIKTNDNFRTE